MTALFCVEKALGAQLFCNEEALSAHGSQSSDVVRCGVADSTRVSLTTAKPSDPSLSDVVPHEGCVTRKPDVLESAEVVRELHGVVGV